MTVGTTAEPPTVTEKSPIVAVPDAIAAPIVTTMLVDAALETRADAMCNRPTWFTALTALCVSMVPVVAAKFCPAVVLFEYATVQLSPRLMLAPRDRVTVPGFVACPNVLVIAVGTATIAKSATLMVPDVIGAFMVTRT
jgi:hypothetical protein